MINTFKTNKRGRFYISSFSSFFGRPCQLIEPSLFCYSHARIKKLPVVLSKEEVAKILSSVDNIKHKAILMLIYSAGLRVGEVVKLKSEDIDNKRMLIHIKGSKGRKDRYTLLSEKTLEVLREYWRRYKPERWLLSGAKEDIYQSEAFRRYSSMHVKKQE